MRKPIGITVPYREVVKKESKIEALEKKIKQLEERVKKLEQEKK